MKFLNTQVLTLLSLVGVNICCGFGIHQDVLQPIENIVLENEYNLIENILNNYSYEDSHKVSAFLEQIDEFESSDNMNALNSNNIKHYSQDFDNLPISLEQYSGQYILRISNWVDDGNLEESFFATALLSIKQMQLSIWEKSFSHKFIDVQVSKDQGIELLSLLSMIYSKPTDFESQIIILDLAQTVYETFPDSEIGFQPTDVDDISLNSEVFFKSYRTLDAIYAWFDLLVETYPDILFVEYIGNTFEGRPMKALRLSVNSDQKADHTKTVVITSGIHAREWISVSSSCYVLFRLLSDYEAGNAAVKRYLENLDFFFLPVMNPDGYEFTWKSERLWRKNKQQTFNPRCSGIDIDHSFGFHFTRGYESPCSDDYPGETEFEALESYNWDVYLNETRATHPIYAYIDLHSYAQEILYPYAYSCDILPRDEENLLELAYGLGQAIRLKTGKYYDVIKACQDKGADLLPSMGAGSALDYMYHNKAYWAFVLKLRDSGTHGFLLPSKFITPVGKEIYASVKYFAAFLLADN